MSADSSSFYKSISAEELEGARNVRFDKTFYEFPFHGPAEAHKVRHCLPVDFEAYGALVLPWRAVDHEGHGLAKGPFETIAEAYARLGLSTPKPVTLERWQTDCRVVEDVRTIPPLARSAFDRFSDQADTVFVRCHHNEVHNWRIESSIFLELSDPFAEMPCPLGSFGIFPRGGSWYLHQHDDQAILYLAGSALLVDQLERICADRFLRLTLEDFYW
jgi:hypothetical protein